MEKFTMVLFVSFFASVCVSQVELSNEEKILLQKQRMLEDAMWLATAIEMPDVSKSQIWTEPLFPTNGVYNANGFRIETQKSPFASDKRINIYSNSQIIAFGKLFEYPTFDGARTALMIELCNRNMDVRELAMLYKVRANDIGDFSVIWPRYGDIADEVIDDFSHSYFIRGAKAISLRGVNKANVRPIAEVLDELLKRPPDQRTGKEFPAPKPPEEKR